MQVSRLRSRDAATVFRFPSSSPLMRRSVALLFLFTVACAERDKSNEIPLGGAPSMQASVDDAGGDGISGTVVEQIPAGGYVYLRLKTGTGEVWAAVGQAPVELGSTVTVEGAMLMEQFESQSLNRTFERIYFGTLAAAGSASAAAAQGASMPPGAASSGTPQPATVQVAKVEKASGPDARTIGDVWAQKEALVGKTVSIRGVVVKYNPGVMGKNWIHLQDGSGDAAGGTHDITVTTMDGVDMGATVTIKGTVRTNKDFGGGYTYALIVEEAKVIK
jgi:hypothetical protein